MSNFNIGDTVRIGKGKVVYRVVETLGDSVELLNLEAVESGRKRNEVEATSVTLVQAAVETAFIEKAEESATKHVTVPATYNRPEDAQSVSVEETTGEAWDPREDRRQSAYGLSILAAVLRKNPNAARLGVNPFKPIGSTRAKVRRAVKAKRTAMHTANARYNTLRRSVA